jgi:regulator of sigma E protease
MPDLGVTQLVIGFLLLLTPVVYFHELGHYWMARKAGVVVEVFSIGFGPEIYGWNSKKTGTRWRIAAIPLGGYVKMRGDEDPASTSSEAAKQAPWVVFGSGAWLADRDRSWRPGGQFHSWNFAVRGGLYDGW